MFLSSVQKQDDVRKIALDNLAELSIKFKPKKYKKYTEQTGKKVFGVPLGALPTTTLNLANGQRLVVPKILHELCNYLLPKITTEGIFRKEGSKVRQNEIKAQLDSGSDLGLGHEVLDISSLLKLFLRELPEPVIPTFYNDLYLQCIQLPKDKTEAILLANLLLPVEHLSALSYLCQFLETVSQKSSTNKMTITNLSVCISPNIFRQNIKSLTKERIDHFTEIFSMLIKDAQYIGVIPQHVFSVLDDPKNQDAAAVAAKGKKRRSGSVSRVFSGLKKIVGTKSNEETPPQSTPDLLLTPSISRSGKKRKIEANGLSHKKKRDVLETLPDNSLLNVPYTPSRTPISVHPNPRTRNKLQLSDENLQSQKGVSCKKWYSRGRALKSAKLTEESSSNTGRKSLGPKSILERRWSAVSQAANFKKNRNKRDSLLLNRKETKLEETDYIRIPKVEYEEIKNKVSEIERRISIELDKVHSEIIKDDNIVSVQTAYEKTLVQAEPMSPTTDQLARRLSRELKIRRPGEQKIIRSPSARKIGSMRRRSRDSEKRNVRLSRQQSWHVSTAQFIPRVNLKRGKPNTVNVGLPTPVKNVEQFICSTPSGNKRNNSSSQLLNKSAQASPLQKSYSFSTSCDSAKWTSGDRFFNNLRTPDSGAVSENCRPSLAKLRSQNAGMVLAKAKLFDNLLDSDCSSASSYKLESSNSSSLSVVKTPAAKSVTNSNNNNNSCRAGKVVPVKKNLSPRKRSSVIPRQKLQDNCKKNSRYASFKENNKTPGTPKTPSIKKTLNVRSPKRLNRTPNTGDRRKTPLKVLTSGTHI